MNQFIFKSFNFDIQKKQIQLIYLYKELEFIEKLTINSNLKIKQDINQNLLDKMLELLHLVSGVSYIKAFLDKGIEIKTPKLSLNLSNFLNSTYKKGLGEFGIINNLNIADKFSFTNSLENVEDDLEDKTNKKLKSKKILVPVGGGKDSLTTLEVLKKLDVVPFVVGSNKIILNQIKNYPFHIFIKREISSELFKLNKNGALNGHIPITAIISVLSIVAAELFNISDIALSLESSANEATINNVNHQYSKSFEFESELSNLINAEYTKDIKIFSLLRPLSELQITKIFTSNKEHLHKFASCNDNFKIKQTKEKTDSLWCNNCPKCSFVYLLLSYFLDDKKVIEIFRNDLLNDINQLNGFKELLEIDNKQKPFECVGETNESRFIFFNLINKPGFKNKIIIKKLKNNKIFTDFNNTFYKKKYLDNLNQEHLVPKHFLELLNEHLRA